MFVQITNDVKIKILNSYPKKIVPTDLQYFYQTIKQEQLNTLISFPFSGRI